ncbi:MAG: hypothetical protein ACD_51C00364G0005 [uncultured bacterium]|nr:MAG: hypothetical protein ACD_51C00364G0005 [uncultured bacterium]
MDINNKLNKRWRFSLGVGTEDSVVDLMQNLVMAKNAPKQLKGSYLIKATASLEVLKMKLRLYIEFNLVNGTIVFQLQSKIDEIGRMLGGWLKSTYST